MHCSCGPSDPLLLDGVLFEKQLSMSNLHSKLHPSKESYVAAWMSRLHAVFTAWMQARR